MKAQKLTKETKLFKLTDKQFYTHTITQVEDDIDYWNIEVDDGGHTCVMKHPTISPHVGDTIRFYGNKYQSMRGVDINGKTVYYRTPSQDDELHKQWVDKQHAKDKKEYEKHKKYYQEQYDSLPPPLKQRMDCLIKKDPDTRFIWEPYELFVVTQAAHMLNHLKTDQEIQDFWKLPWAKQKELVPELDDGHSNNTFGCAVSLARSTILNNPHTKS